MLKDVFTICIDIDDTIENLLQAWVKWLNSKHGLNVHAEDVTDWDISIFYPELTSEQVYEPLHYEEFWKHVEPKYDAIEYISKLVSENNNIYLCTSTHYNNIKFKYEHIIEKFFPFIDWDKVIITQNKQMIKCDIMIDDGPHNLIDGDYVRILFDAPHNRKFKEKAFNIKRCYDWKEVYDYIHNIHK